MGPEMGTMLRRLWLFHGGDKIDWLRKTPKIDIVNSSLI
jgi:hypothetical protein